MEAKDNLVLKLQELAQSDKLPINTSELAQQLELSRSVTSHYLNQLTDEGIVVKGEGRPVLWNLVGEETTAPKKVTAFNNFIGANSSLKNVVSQCEAAVHYPPNGLSIIITGNSGVGKSYLAKKLYQYAISSKAIADNAPFLTLNCADYANNPELLSSILFGYAKGAFTGANETKSGLLEKADGGYLFLDEVHRLSSENQEKLFSFIDSGSFRRVGENDTEQHAKVRFMFATTENTDDVLLETFRRRISIAVHLPDYDQRPRNERLNLVYSIFYNEAQKMQRPLKVYNDALESLVSLKSNGNIGRLKNLIKVGCANAYKDQQNAPVIAVKHNEFILQSNVPATDDFIMIDPEKNYDFTKSCSDNVAKEKITKAITELLKSESNLLTYNRKKAIRDLEKFDESMTMTEFDQPTYLKFKQKMDRVVSKQFGIHDIGNLSSIIYKLYKINFTIADKQLTSFINKLKSFCPRSYHVANYFFKSLNYRCYSLKTILALLLSERVDETLQLRGLLLAHGEDTATSIQAVVNQLCGNYVFDAIDMPIDTGIADIVKKTKDLFDSYDTSNGTVMLVDMGSLNQLYSEIKSHLNGDLLVIDNLTTATALDVALKIQSKTAFKTIAAAAESEYEIHSQYYSGYSDKKNIIISCISGLGISEKIKETMAPYLPKDIQINTIDYYDLKSNIHQNDNHYFDTTLFVLTTTSLPDDFNIPNINIYDLLDAKGEQKLGKLLAPYLNPDSVDKVNQELLRFFSIEGVSERLSFLNPKIIIKEVETVIYKYESYYDLKLDGKIKLNLYMHIALMIERLMIRKAPKVPEITPSKDEKEFISISKSIFQPLELKYNVEVNDYELSLMYEVFKELF
ncbi:sigma 54-interacting transcriptional regulator [Companilactobacillus nantensis]|uniref:DNA translocase FtsK n=1 Tax=Companilactobacillus nantensis DSM 16982 TaxID=1423774 RepID=A0A0R1WAC0_9LACO|nr:sigma 54-interacting transcriptional regulator [Companilactobacillus nantensis]KRM14858.1 transcription regulator of PTS system [Companilactobacillus nantensis DSM 16982]GEO63821.1 transcriptional antiterminator [Companilactobacillus nantensis]